LPVVNLSGTNTQYDLEAVSLEYFVSNGSESLYTYRIVASDGWNPWTNRSMRDLYWDVFTQGYLLLIDPFRTYFHDFSQDMNFGFNVQSVQEIQMYRTITVVKPDGTSALFQINIISEHQMINPQNDNSLDRAIRLSDLITEYVTSTATRYEYRLIAADYDGNRGFAVFSWAQLQGAYYSRDIERVFFPVITDFTGAMRLRDLVRVEVHGI
jgi:hypothetical protein